MLPGVSQALSATSKRSPLEASAGGATMALSKSSENTGGRKQHDRQSFGRNRDGGSARRRAGNRGAGGTRGHDRGQPGEDAASGGERSVRRHRDRDHGDAGDYQEREGRQQNLSADRPHRGGPGPPCDDRPV